METISLVRDKQNDVNKRVRTIKKDIKSGNFEIKRKPQKINKIKKKLFKFKKGGAIYLGHIPHGFYEDEMISYFNQFGRVTSVTVARSKKTGKSKGYGFVEFADEEVAKVAAETMNNYLMFNRVIKCRYIPPEERKGNIFVRTLNPSNYAKQKNRKNNARNKSKAIMNVTEEAYQKKTNKKIEEIKKFFEEKGIDFTYKINGNYKENNSPKSSSSVSAELDRSFESDYEDETDDQFGVLEIDESDNEIYFKTPPQVKKVIKRSFDSPVVPLQMKLPLGKSSEINFNKLISKKNVKTQSLEKGLMATLGRKNKKAERNFKKVSQSFLKKGKINVKGKFVKSKKKINCKKSYSYKRIKMNANFNNNCA